MTAISNSPHYDAAIKIASTVGTNIRTLRTNQRALACGLILAVAVEGFKWRDAWDAMKKASKFSTMEKDEQNRLNVMGTACRTVIDHFDKLDKDQREAIGNLTATVSTMAKAIKDAEKAKDAADKEEADKAAAAEAASQMADADIDGTPAPVVETVESANVAALRMTIALLGQDSFASEETPLVIELMAAVDALRAKIAAVSKAA